MAKRIFIFLFVLINLLNFRLSIGQTISKIDAQIDSLENIKKDLEKKLEIINEKILELKSKKEITELKKINESKILSKTKNKTYLLSEPSNLSKKIISIPAKSEVELIGYINSFFKVIYNKKIGFIWDLYVEKNSMIETFKKSKTNQTKIEEKQRKERLLAERKRRLKNKFGPTITKKILDSKIWIGMTKDMTIESWGKPKDINRTVGEWGVHEQWIYTNTYLYFENGKLKSWQD